MGRPKKTIPTLTRGQMVEKLSARLVEQKITLDKKSLNLILTDMVKEMASALGKGHRVEFRGVGALHPVIRKAKYVRNIAKGQGYLYPPTIGIKFVSAQAMNDRLQKLGRYYRDQDLI